MIRSPRARGRALGGVFVAALVVASLVLAPAAGATRPGSKYLALGDSLAYGYQAAKFNSQIPAVNPASFNTGYVDDFAFYLKLLKPSLTVTNDGCPGETTDSFINGGPVPGTCASGFPAYWLHHPYTGSQLADGLATIAANPNTNPITVDLGANDVLNFLHGCGFPAPTATACIASGLPGLYAHIGQNMGIILSQLRAAAPTAEIDVVGLYNPYPAVIQPPLPGGDALTATLNGIIKSVATATGARFADPLPVFNPASRSTTASESIDIPVICVFTGMCPGPASSGNPFGYNPASPTADIHPTNLGYAALAAVVASASGMRP
jgi:lysophospholipase L1-like esterase